MLGNKPAPQKSRERAPLVVEEKGIRSLEFARGSVQSAMDVRRPTRLVLSYTRAMMSFALFVPAPRHILMVGLGGGSMAKFCYRHFPNAKITIIEKRADVIALRADFCVPPDDARFQVLLGDATSHIASLRDCVDVLVVDGFDELGLPSALGHPKFYADCKRALRTGGVMVKNIFSYDPAYATMLARLSLVFDKRVCWFQGVAGNNRILFAVRGEANRAARLQAWVARRQGVGAAWLNRLLARLVVFYLSLH